MIELIFIRSHAEFGLQCNHVASLFNRVVPENLPKIKVVVPEIFQNPDSTKTFLVEEKLEDPSTLPSSKK
jgi:hypothetical protein